MIHDSNQTWPAIADQAGDLGDGQIDNLIIESSVHVVNGVLVLLALVASTGLVLFHAYRNEPISRTAKVAILAAQVTLGVQVLLGIKLLDQGQGIVQLYIHYVGGLVPLGAFLAAGWFARGDTGRSSRVLAALLVLGSVAAFMAFIIGRSFANA